MLKIISLDELLEVISESINVVVSFLKDTTFELGEVTFSFWILLLAFFVLEALILILLKRGGKND